MTKRLVLTKVVITVYANSDLPESELDKIADEVNDAIQNMRETISCAIESVAPDKLIVSII